MSFSEPEGFAYYALHPGDFADVVRPFAGVDSVALIGIRSIGATLSGVAQVHQPSGNLFTEV